MICNNLSECHDPEVIGEDYSAIRLHCRQCGLEERIGKDFKGNPEHRRYGEWYKRDIVQPDHPLYYKYAGAKGMNVV